jgi:hypothetical protein
MTDAMVVTVGVNEARVNVTWKGSNGDLPDPVSVDAQDADVKRWVQEAVRTGGVPGIAADPTADFTDFVVDRFQPTEVRPWAMFATRPKTPFGTGFLEFPRLRSVRCRPSTSGSWTRSCG